MSENGQHQSVTRRLTPKQAADRLGVSLITMARYRKRRQGPKYERIFSRIYYPEEEFEKWRAAQAWA